MKKLLFIICSGIFASCASDTTSDTVKDTTVVKQETPVLPNTEDTKDDQLNGCYTMVIEKDTAHLKLDVNGSAVTGNLSYKRFQKDSNNGSITGTIHEDLIKLMYSFQSEGMVSVREVYFRIIGNKLAEGYGDIDLRNDTAFFKYPTTLRYEEKHPFIKEACR